MDWLIFGLHSPAFLTQNFLSLAFWTRNRFLFLAPLHQWMKDSLQRNRTFATLGLSTIDYYHSAGNSKILPKKLGKNYPRTLGNITEQSSGILPKNYWEIIPNTFREFYRNILLEKFWVLVLKTYPNFLLPSGIDILWKSSESFFPKHIKVFIIGYRGIWHR